MFQCYRAGVLLEIRARIFQKTARQSLDRSKKNGMNGLSFMPGGQ
jgi:hypothetical protein